MLKSTTIIETWLMIDIRAARKAFENGDISNITWQRFTKNAAEELTKMKQCEALEEILTYETTNTQVQQWLERATTSGVKFQSAPTRKQNSSERK